MISLGAKADEKLLVVVRGEIGISILSFLISEMKNWYLAGDEGIDHPLV